MVSKFSTKVLLTVWFLLLALTGLGAADPMQIRCAEIPKEGIQNLNYETVWEQSTESEDFLIASIIDVAYDPSGNICIVDYEQKNLVILDPDGSYLRTLGRPGDGPGELSDARKIFFDGDRYGLLQVFPGAIVWLNFDGSPGGKVTMGNSDPNSMQILSAASALQDGSQIFAWTNQFNMSDSGEMQEDENIFVLGHDGSLDQILYKAPEGEKAVEGDRIDEGKVYDIWLRRWTLDGDGGIWVAPLRDKFVLQHWNSKGELELEVTKDYELVSRTKAGSEEMLTWFKRRGWTENQIKVGETAPVVNSLHLGEDGNIWVQLDQGGKRDDSDLVAVYDVINQEGQYLKQVAYHLEQEFSSWRRLDETTVLVMTTDLDEEEQKILLLKAVEVK